VKTNEERLQDKIAQLQTFLAALGFVRMSLAGDCYAYHHNRAKPCSCGKYPVVMEYMYTPGNWVAICNNCGARTVEASNPIEAVRFWNQEKYSEGTLLTRNKLTAKTMDDIGAQNLTEAAKHQAVMDLVFEVKNHNLDSPVAKEAIWFIHNKKAVDDIISGRTEGVTNDLRRKGSNNPKD